MYPPVDQIGHSLPETFPTSFTDKRPLPAVDPLVVLQGGELLEGASARAARVRLLVRMIQHVLMVALLEGKSFPTEVAGVRGFPCVKPPVLLQKVLRGELLPAIAAVPEFCVVTLQMCLVLSNLSEGLSRMFVR